MPTDVQRALWAAIRADPDADTPRLVYADWLDENGDPERAEFIRAQCHLAAAPRFLLNDTPVRVVRRRERQLLADHGRAWAGAAVAAVPGGFAALGWARHGRPGFRRGFPSDFALSLANAARFAAAGPDLEPVFDVTVLDWMGDREAEVAAVGGSGFAGCVRVLDLMGATDEVARRAAGPGGWHRLTTLRLRDGSVGDGGVTALAGGAVLAGVEHLGLYDTPEVGDTGAFALAGSPHLGRLRQLDVYRTGIGPAGVARLRERFGDAVQL